MSARELRRAQPWLGTVVEIVACEAPARILERGVRAAFAAVAEVQRLMSFHDPTSELAQLNLRAAGKSVAVSAWTWEVLRLAVQLAEESGGIFDPTIAPQLAAWDFLPTPEGTRPGARANWREIRFLPGRRIRFVRPVWLDLGGIAKGFAVDRAVEAMRAAGVPAGLVNAGGDLRGYGARDWPIHLRAPDAPGESAGMLVLRESALATSALYFSTKRRAGRVRTPLLDGRTRRCARVARSVSVLAGDAATADALTKIVFAGPARAAALLIRHGARALVLAKGRAPVQVPALHAPKRPAT